MYIGPVHWHRDAKTLHSDKKKTPMATTWWPFLNLPRGYSVLILWSPLIASRKVFSPLTCACFEMSGTLFMHMSRLLLLTTTITTNSNPNPNPRCFEYILSITSDICKYWIFIIHPFRWLLTLYLNREVIYTFFSGVVSLKVEPVNHICHWSWPSCFGLQPLCNGTLFMVFVSLCRIVIDALLV